MASRKIIGTTHIRRKLSKKAKAAIAALAVFAVGIGGFLFVNNTDAGAGIKNKVAGMSVVSEDGGFGGLFGVGNTPTSKTQSIIKIDTEVVTVRDFDGAEIDINTTGGFVYGAGTLRDGDVLELNIEPFPGYAFRKIHLVEQNIWKDFEDVSGRSTVKIGYNDGSEDVISVDQNTTVEVYFIKDDTGPYNYTVNVVPQIGKYTNVQVARDNSYEYLPSNSPKVYFNRNEGNTPTGLNSVWELTYSELDAYFNYTQETYSFGSNSSSGSNSSTTDTDDGHSTSSGSNSSSGSTTNDSIVVSKTYNVIYDLYAFNDDGIIVYSELNNSCPVKVDFFDVEYDPYHPQPILSAYSNSYKILRDNSWTYRFNLDDHDVFSKNCTFTLVPHTKDGSAYQVITKSDPSIGGTTFGDRISGEAFTTTISAVPSEKYKFDSWTWVENSGFNETRNMDSKDRTLSVTPKGISVYTAHFVYETYNVELESATPDEGGTVVGTGDYMVHSDVNITLKPSPGYKVESWNYSTPDGSRYSGDSEEFTIKDITSDIKLNVKFTNGKARIDVKASPVDGGSVTVENTTSSKGEKPDYEEFAPGVEGARLKAIPAENNIFLYWKDSAGKRYDAIDPFGVNTFELPSVASSETFTAYFAPREIKITTKVYPNYDNAGDPVNPGSITVSGDEVRHTMESPTEYSADSYTAVTFNAVEASGYHFQKFVDGDGNEYTSNPLVKTDLVKDTTITAIFIPDEFTINAQATPVSGGEVTVNDRSGSNKVSYNENVVIKAIANEGFNFKYFEDQHGTKYGPKGYDENNNPYFEFKAVNGEETFKAVFGLAELDLSISVDPDYYAGGFKLDYIANDGNRFNPSEAFQGERSTLEGSIPKVKGGTSLKITAVEGDGYHFSKFVDTDGNVYTENPLVYPDLSENKDVEIIFVPDRFTINAKSSPVTGGTVDVAILDATGTVTSRREGSNEVSYNEKVRIIAKPNSNFAFRYFEDPSGAKYGPTGDEYGNPYFEFNAVNGAETYKAVFGLAQLSLNVKVDEVVEGDNPYKTGGYRVDYTNSWYPQSAESKTSYKEETFTDVAGGKTVKITAIPGDGYHFSKFVDTDGNVYTENPLVYPNLTENKSVEVIFVPDTFTISATASPSTGGSVDVAVLNDDGTIKTKREGSNTVSYNDLVRLIAKPISPGFDFRYFEDENGNKYGGKEETIDGRTCRTLDIKAVNGSEKYKAVFAINTITLNVKVDPNTASSGKYVAGGFRVDYTNTDGTSIKGDSTYEPTSIANIKGQTSVKITAVDGDGYHFSKFVDTDGNVYTENPLVYPDLVENKDVEIIFVPDSFTINAHATPVTGGKANVIVGTSEREGSNTVGYNDEVTIVAIPNAGYSFRYFEDQNGTRFSGEPVIQAAGQYKFTFKAVNGTETYKAVFGIKEVSLKVKVDPPTFRASDNKYVAGSFKIDYTDSDFAPHSIHYYSETEIDNVKGGKSVKITAIEGDGYHFSKFVDTDGNVYTENPLIYPDLYENKEVDIIYIPETFTISATASPSTGGSVDVAVLDKAHSAHPIVTRREGSNTVAYDDLVKLIAKPNTPDFDFRYFEDQNGNKYSGKDEEIDGHTYRTLDIKAVNGSEKFKAVFAISAIKLDVKVDPSNVDDSGNYIAGGFKVDYTGLNGLPAQILPTYKPAHVPSIKGQTSVKITALDGDGYHFAKFVDTDGNTYTDNPLIYPDLVENKDVEIIFVPDRFTINAKSVPVTGGTVDVAIINKDTGAEISKREGSNEVSYNEKVRIIAKPSGNFAFRYFEDPNGAKYGPTGHDDSGNPYFEFNAVNGAETYKAVFAMDTVTLKVKVDPSTVDGRGKYIAGGFKVNYTYIDEAGKEQNKDELGDSPGFEINNIKGQTSVKITAIEDGGYKFSKFIDSEGNIWNDNPMVLGDLIENKEIEVIFVKEHWRIEAVSSPEAGGVVTLNDTLSGLDVDYGDHVSIEAIANPGYRFKYFKDDLGNEFLANPIDFDAINGSEKYTAYFAKDDVSITLDLAPEGAGTVRFESEPAVSKRTPYPTGGKSSVTLTATPKEDVSFLYWRDQDGKMYNDNPLVLSDISADLIFTAVFDTKYDTIRAVASPASGGRIRKIVNDNGSITLVAIANRGYSFIRWQKPVGTATVYRLDIKAEDVHSGDLYTAIFRADSNYDWRSDITKEKFYREWRKVITPNYTVTRDSMKLLAMQSVAGLRQYDDATPPLKSYGAIANAQAYFDEKTARDAARLDGVFGDAELMTAEGDILRPDALPDADKYQQDAEDFTDRKFGDLYETEILTVKRVLEPDDFDNIKRTYLWRYTGAEYKDNIYLLYNIGGSKPDWATPIVDEDGVLKFTIDELDSYDVVAVVRVKIKEK